MIWIEVIAYFAVWSAVLIGVFSAYARLLRLAARFTGTAKLVFSVGIYGIFSCVVALPMLGIVIFEEWRHLLDSSRLFYLMYLLCYLLAVLPGGWNFKRRHLGELRRLGYFKARSLNGMQ